MFFYIPAECYIKITTEITTPKGKPSPSKQLFHFYIIHHLIWHLIFIKDDYKKGIPLCTSLLTDIFKRGKLVNDAIQYLVDNKIIYVVNDSYKVGEFSKRYKLHKLIDVERICMVNFDKIDFALVRHLENRNEKVKLNIDQLEVIKKNLKINEEGKKFLTEKYNVENINDLMGSIPIQRCDINLILIAKGIFYGSRPDLESRFYSNLTSLKREYRKYILLDDKPILMTDISNSQVLLSYPLIIQKMKEMGHDTNKLPEDILAYKNLSQNGTVYEYLVEKLNDILTRDVLKKKFFKETFFCKVRKFYKDEYEEAPVGFMFRKVFPKVNFYINQIKKNDYKQFAISLQRFEASIIIDCVYRDLRLENRCVLTLHDAIVCNNISDLERAETVIKKYLLKYGLKPHLKRENGLEKMMAA